MTKIKKTQIIILLFTFCFLFSYNSVKAAKLDLTSEIQEIGINQQLQVNLVLDTENEEINAVEGKIIFPEDLLELKEIRDGNSIINFWIERPGIKPDNQIIFSGIIPGGYVGEKGLTFSLIFQTKNEGRGVIEIRESKTLLNDGKGTPAKLLVSNFQFSISEQAPKIQVSQIEDNESPEIFQPIVSKNPEIFEGKYFLVFATQDKGSGIDRYEILEEEQRGSIWDLVKKEKWQIGESPYLLKDQKLKSYIYVKAIDKTGNEKIAELPPQNFLEWYENYYIWGKIIIGIIFIYITWIILRKKRFYTPVC